MYPLREDFEPAIIEFIERLKHHTEINVRVNPTATHVFGEYTKVMQILQREIKLSFEKYNRVVFAFKVLNGDLEHSLDGMGL